MCTSLSVHLCIYLPIYYWCLFICPHMYVLSMDLYLVVKQYTSFRLWVDRPSSWWLHAALQQTCVDTSQEHVYVCVIPKNWWQRQQTFHACKQKETYNSSNWALKLYVLLIFFGRYCSESPFFFFSAFSAQIKQQHTPLPKEKCHDGTVQQPMQQSPLPRAHESCYVLLLLCVRTARLLHCTYTQSVA